MTDLVKLADAISTKSPAIRAFAQESAIRTVSLEGRVGSIDDELAKAISQIYALDARLAKLEAPAPVQPSGLPKVLHGAWVTEPNTAGAPDDMGQFARRWPAEQKACLIHWSPPLYPNAQQWLNVKAYNPHAIALVDPSIIGLGSTPCASIASGVQDAVLSAFADKVKATGVRTIVRFAHEFNFPASTAWAYPWAKEGPTVFKAAWARVANIMRSRGLEMAWCPNMWWTGSVAVDPTPWIPADISTVDWVMADGYNDWAAPGASFTRLFGTAINYFKSGPLKGKPIVIGETSVIQAGYTVAQQQAWVEDAMRQTVTQGLAGICLFIRAHDDGSWRWSDDGAMAAVANVVKTVPEYQP